MQIELEIAQLKARIDAIENALTSPRNTQSKYLDFYTKLENAIGAPISFAFTDELDMKRFQTSLTQRYKGTKHKARTMTTAGGLVCVLEKEGA